MISWHKINILNLLTHFNFNKNIILYNFTEKLYGSKNLNSKRKEQTFQVENII